MFRSINFYNNRSRGRMVLKAFLKHDSTSKSLSLLNKCLTFITFMENGDLLWYFLSIYGILGKGFPVNQSRRKTSTWHALFILSQMKYINSASTRTIYIGAQVIISKCILVLSEFRSMPIWWRCTTYYVHIDQNIIRYKS